MENETIAAIATPDGTGGIGIIRISGPAAVAVADRVFSGKRPVSALHGYEAAYGHACRRDGTVLDEILALRFCKPHSYTGEDCVELSCHGGGAVLQSVLEAVLAAGAAPAGRGAFTKQALLNGKLTLTQAEGVAALIAAQSRQAAGLALAQREGRLYQELTAIALRLTDLLAHVSAFIDFPEEDLPPVEEKTLLAGMEQQNRLLLRLLDTYDSGQILQTGIRTVLLGPPNAGKSSLMNRLCGQKTSIVTDVPGTTRDPITAQIRLSELTLLLYDTAGLTKTDDVVESIGVQLAEEKLERAQLILLVLSPENAALNPAWLDRIAEKPAILLWNKTDLSDAPIPEELQRRFPHALSVSAKTGAGLETFEEEIRKAVSLHHLSAEEAVLLNLRQKTDALRAQEALQKAMTLLQQRHDLDLTGVLLQEALDHLYALTGQKADDAVIDRVFETFCVGK